MAGNKLDLSTLETWLWEAACKIRGPVDARVEGKSLEEIEATLRAHREILRNKFHVERIGIFGSYVRREATPTSDLDILVELDRPVGWEIVDLQCYLENLLEVKVDLVTKGAVFVNLSFGSPFGRI